VCDPENVKNEEAMTRAGSQSHSKKKRIMKVKVPLFFETQGKTNLARRRHIPEDTNASFDNYKN
jgi:hypothetical protein